MACNNRNRGDLPLDGYEIVQQIVDAGKGNPGAQAAAQDELAKLFRLVRTLEREGQVRNMVIAKNDGFVLYTQAPDSRIWFDDREIDNINAHVAGDTFTPAREGWYECRLTVHSVRALAGTGQDPAEVEGALNCEIRRDGGSGLTEVASTELGYATPISFQDGYTYQGYPGASCSGIVYCNGTDDDIYAVGTLRTYNGLPPRWETFYCRMQIIYLGNTPINTSVGLYPYSFTTPDPSIWLASSQSGFPVLNSGDNGIESPIIDSGNGLSNNFFPNSSHTNPTDDGDWWSFDASTDRLYIAGYGPGFKLHGFTAAICMRYNTSWPWSAADQILGHQSSSGFTSELHVTANSTQGQFRAYIEDDFLGGIAYDTGYTAVTGAGSADTWFILVVAVDEDSIAIGVPGTSDVVDTVLSGSNVVRDSYRNYLRVNASGRTGWDVAGIYMWDTYIAPSAVTLTTTDFGL